MSLALRLSLVFFLFTACSSSEKKEQPKTETEKKFDAPTPLPIGTIGKSEGDGLQLQIQPAKKVDAANAAASVKVPPTIEVNSTKEESSKDAAAIIGIKPSDTSAQAIKKIEQIPPSTSTTAADHEARAVSPKKTAPPSATIGVDPVKALGWLKNGNARFVKRNFRSDGLSAVDRQKLLTSQRPHSAILSCSDSRVPPEIIFDQKLGELFVTRTLAHAVDESVLASLEHAVTNLGVRNIVILGHDDCEKGTDAKTQAAGTMNDLLSRSSVLKSKSESGEIKISIGIYHLKSGEVSL